MSATLKAPLAAVMRRSTEIDQAFHPAPGLFASLGSAAPGSDQVAQLTQVIRKVLPLSAAAKQASHEIWDAAMTGEITDMQEAGEVLFAFWDKCINIISYLHNAACLLEKNGLPVPEMMHLEEAVAKAKSQRDESHRTWPWFTEEDRKIIQGEIERGEGVTVEELLRELQSRGIHPSSKTHREMETAG